MNLCKTALTFVHLADGGYRYSSSLTIGFLNIVHEFADIVISNNNNNIKLTSRALFTRALCKTLSQYKIRQWWVVGNIFAEAKDE